MKKNARMLHRLLAMLLILFLIGCKTGQKNTDAKAKLADSSRQEDPAHEEPEQNTPEQDVHDQEEPAQESQVIPWGKDEPIVQQAEDSGSMIICFMSGEGVKINSSSDTAFAEQKWGDSALIAFPNGQTMLIDGAMQDYAWLLVENLIALGISKLDYVVVSHRHNDHIGGLTCMDGVLERFEIGQIYSSGIYNGNSSDPAAIEACARKRDIPCDTLAKGDTLMIGDVQVEVLWPLPGQEKTVSSSTEDCNNSSLVLRFDYGQTSALFTGDLYRAAEQQLIQELGDDIDKLDAGVLKIPHHGRQTSSSSDFIKAVSPQVGVATGAIIMEPAIYASYAKEGTAVYMDVYDGYVKVMMNGSNVKVESSRVRNVDTYDKYDAAFGIQRD